MFTFKISSWALFVPSVILLLLDQYQDFETLEAISFFILYALTIVSIFMTSMSIPIFLLWPKGFSITSSKIKVFALLRVYLSCLVLWFLVSQTLAAILAITFFISQSLYIYRATNPKLDFDFYSG